MPYHPNQTAVFAYVRGLLTMDSRRGGHGRRPVVGRLWQLAIRPREVPDPVGMAAQLHDMGCGHAWVVLFVSPDSEFPQA
jgi:hypothetical protein